MRESSPKCVNVGIGGQPIPNDACPADPVGEILWKMRWKQDSQSNYSLREDVNALANALGKERLENAAMRRELADLRRAVARLEVGAKLAEAERALDFASLDNAITAAVQANDDDATKQAQAAKARAMRAIGMPHTPGFGENSPAAGSAQNAEK